MLDESWYDAEVMVTSTSETERVSIDLETVSFERREIVEIVVCSITSLALRDIVAKLVIVVFSEIEVILDALVTFLVLVKRLSLRVLESSSETVTEITIMELYEIGTTDGHGDTVTLFLCWQTAGAKGNERKIFIFHI